MSFSVDLWNGFEIIKEKFNTTHKHIKAFNKLLNRFVSFEKDYCTNLDYLYKEFKDTGNINYPLEQSRLNIINMIDFESKRRKEFITYITKNIIEKISLYLSEPKISLEQLFLDGEELTTNFNKTLGKLISKQEAFHSQCKELSSFISQFELDNSMSDKMSLAKCQKILTKVNKSRDEYLFYINETNIERNRYNYKIEEILNKLEKTYRKTIQRFKDYLFDFAHQKYLSLQISYEKEKSNYEKYHSKIDLDQEELLFIMKNATKEFPMIKIEFCPLKPNAIGKFIKSKYRDKLNEKDYNRILKSIQTYFQNHNVFPNNLIQTGVSKISSSKNQFEFFTGRRFTKKEKNYIFDQYGKKLNTIEDKIKDKSPAEKEVIIMNNINFIKNFINELITNGKVKMYEDKLNNSENIFKLDDNKDQKEKLEKMDQNQKVNELFNLINISNESSPVYIEAFIKALSFLRSKGYFEINKFNYNLLQLIFIRILEENPRDDYMLKNILILAQTFFYTDDEEKIYLQKGIKGNEVLNSPETWHRCINYTICLANTDKDLTISIKKNDLINKINKEAFVTVVSYLCDIKIFTTESNTFDKVKYFYANIYNLDEKAVDQNVEDYLNNYNKKLQKNKEKEKNKKMELKNESIGTENKGNEMETKRGETPNEDIKNKNEIKEEETKEKEKEKEKEIKKTEIKENVIKESEIKEETKNIINNEETITNEKENIEYSNSDNNPIKNMDIENKINNDNEENSNEEKSDEEKSNEEKNNIININSEENINENKKENEDQDDDT